MTTAPSLLKTGTLAAVLTLAASSAFAQAFDAVRLYGAAPGKDGGTAGAAVLAGYEYRGSDERRTRVLPVLDYQWANGWFAGVTNGIGYNFSRSPGKQFGLRLTADLGRKESRTDALRGMGDVDPSAEIGAFHNCSSSSGWFLTSSVRYGSGTDNKGLVVDLGMGYSKEVAPSWRLGTGTAVTLANSQHMQSFFGVTESQSASSGYASYIAGSGARDVRANVAITYSIDARTSVTAALSASRLLGDAKDSPLTRKRTSGSALLAVAYGF